MYALAWSWQNFPLHPQTPTARQRMMGRHVRPQLHQHMHGACRLAAGSVDETWARKDYTLEHNKNDRQTTKALLTSI